jgi:beta-glucosidase
MIDYKHFDANNIDLLFEFGFGLSYTQFELDEDSLGIKVQPGLKASLDRTAGKIPGGWRDLWTEAATVSIKVENVGQSLGFVVLQLYLAFPQDTTPSGTPLRVLRGFGKKFLERRTTKTIDFSLTRKDVSY